MTPGSDTWAVREGWAAVTPLGLRSDVPFSQVDNLNKHDGASGMKMSKSSKGMGICMHKDFCSHITTSPYSHPTLQFIPPIDPLQFFSPNLLHRGQEGKVVPTMWTWASLSFYAPLSRQQPCHWESRRKVAAGYDACSALIVQYNAGQGLTAPKGPPRDWHFRSGLGAGCQCPSKSYESVIIAMCPHA